MKNLFTKPLKLIPNLRVETSQAQVGYTWGKIAEESNILTTINPEFLDLIDPIQDDDIVAERWICSDDRELGSKVMIRDGKAKLLATLIEKHTKEILGPTHLAKFGPYLGCIMKQLDTNPLPHKGSLSVQVHPQVGHPTRPSKPEMWKGMGQVYLGWNKNVDEKEITQACQENNLEKLMNLLDLKDQYILVKGGMIHAIRYNSYLFEWSKAPDAVDIKKGNIKDATISPYDRTDGKTPRPGKENLADTFEVLRHARAFKKSPINELVTTIKLLNQDQERNKKTRLFTTPDVCVDQLEVQTEMELSLKDRGLPLYLEKGEVAILNQAGEVIDQLVAGDERFLPFVLEKITLKALQPSLLQTWWRPF